MSNLKLYEYAIILQQKKVKDEVKEKGQLLKRGEVLAESEEHAQIMAAREIPEAHLAHLERVTLAMRPF